jgi:membrane-associated protease RseP (regulator of RpoE activity)
MRISVLVVTLLHVAFLPLAGTADEAAEELRLNYLALDLMLEGQARVMRIADRMRIASADLCGRKIGPVLGVYAPSRQSIRDRWRKKDFIDPFVEAAQRRYSLGSDPRVLVLVPGLAAERAGLRAGDLVTAVDGKPMKRVEIELLRNRGKSGVVDLTVEREGGSATLEMDAEMGCTIASRFTFGPTINAFAMSFGKLTGIYFYSGMLNFLPDDDDLAVVVGHELAHLVLGHTSHLRTSKRFEAESDYLGLYFAARAGYDISHAPEVWDAFARNNPYASVDWGFYAHPTSATRSLELLGGIKEIHRKQEEGLPLVPEKGRLALDRPDVGEEAVEAHQSKLREEALERLRSDIRRIQNVSYRLVVAGASVCGEQIAPVLGATVARRQDFLRAKKAEGEAAFGVGNNVSVLAVAAGSPAERAGLREGDRILSVDGSRIRRTKHVFDRMRKSRSGDPTLIIGRGQDEIEMTLPRVEGCEHGTLVSVSGSVDTTTHTNKHDMWIPTGLLRFVKDDDELAIAISHQIGHQLIGTFRTGKDEPHADELGLRIAAQAGFDISKASAFWDRVAAEEFWKISSDMDGGYIAHGAMSRRILAIRSVITERENLTTPDNGARSSSGEDASRSASIRDEMSAP